MTTCTNKEEEGSNLRDVGGQGVGDRLLQIVEDKSTLFDTGNDGGKVVVKQDHVSCLNIILESSEEDEVAGFFVLSHLCMRGYFRLG